MSANYNQKLYELTSVTALSECVIPVIICDKNFRISMISQGARNTLRPISLGKDISKMFSDEEKYTLGALVGATLAEPTLGNSKAPVICVGGTIEDERYLAIIFEPQAILWKVSGYWYVGMALTAVSDALAQLITAEKASIKHLEWSIAMLARLTQFSKQQQERGLYSAVHSSDIYTELDIVIEESSSALVAIGASIKYNKDMNEPFTTRVQPFHVYLTVTTLICALALISSDGAVTADCRIGIDGSFLDISLMVSPDLTGEIPESFDGLISCAPHLYLELAAVKDLTSPLGVLLECEGGDGALTICVRIPADTSGTVKFCAADIVGAATVRKHLTSLCEYVHSLKE